MSSLKVIDEPVTEVPLAELGDRIVGLAGRLAAATCRWLLLVAEFDRREGFAGWGLASTARWLSHTCGLSRRTALEHVRVAVALRDIPALAAEMRRGRLSYSQVRAISRVVEPGDDVVVADLVQAAQHCSVGQLESVVRGLRTVERIETGVDDSGEYLRHSWRPDGRWRLNARLEPDRGELVQSAVASVARAEGLNYADALVRMSEIALAAVNDSEHPPRPLRGDERAAVVVHVDATSDRPDNPKSRATPRARIEDGPALDDGVVERLLCSSRLRIIQRDPRGRIRNLGRSRRVVSARLFRALLIRDHGRCAHPGCESRAGLQAHHVRHWIDGGRTDLDNLVLLCERHHRAHHDGEFSISPLGRQRFAFRRRGGLDLSRPPTPDRLAPKYRPVESVHRDIAADAATPEWDGTRVDQRFAVDTLSAARSRERTRVTETDGGQTA